MLFWLFCFILLVFVNFLEPESHFAFKISSNICDSNVGESFIVTKLMSNITTFTAPVILPDWLHRYVSVHNSVAQYCSDCLAGPSY